MELAQRGWISGESAPFTSEAVEVGGISEATLQVTGGTNSQAYVQGSIDGTNFETLGSVSVTEEGTELGTFNLTGTRFVRVHLINDGGGTPTVSAVLR